MRPADFEEWDSLAVDPEALFARLREVLEGEGRFQELFEALQLERRHELELPLVGNVDLDGFSIEVRTKFDRAFRDDCRDVGDRLLKRGDIVGAWPYFQAIQDPAPVAAALDAWKPGPETSREELQQIIQIGFGLGVNPVRGYELVLSSGGTCDGINIIEQHFPFGPAVRERCVGLLVDQLHREVTDGVRKLLESRSVALEVDVGLGDWLHRHGNELTGPMCPVDDSHLQAVIRFSLASRDPETLRRATELAKFGTLLDDSYQRQEAAPFQDFYRDYHVLLSGLAGQQPPEVVEAHFGSKLDGLSGSGARFPAEVLVFAQHRLGRSHSALETYERHLLEPGRALNLAPPLAELCSAAGNYRLLRETAKAQGNLARYAAALLSSPLEHRPR